MAIVAAAMLARSSASTSALILSSSCFSDNTVATDSAWAHDVQNRFPPDAVRYYLAASAPEGRDTSWYWNEFIRRNNDELVATWGNLVHRIANLAHRNYGRVPQPGDFSEADKAILGIGAAAFNKVGTLLDSIQIKAALQEAFALAHAANQCVADHNSRGGS
jgi:methionyl-tRNA synthetase